MDKSDTDPQQAGDSLGGRAMRRAGCWLIVGTIAGLVVTLAVLRYRLADPTPALTTESFRQARENWRQHGPDNYDIEVEVQGPQPGKYRVSVRGGQALAATRNDRALTQQRTLGTWSVPGMFGTIGRDVEQVERRRAGQGDRNTSDLTLRASFDPELGIPRRYLRMEAGSTQDVTWEVTRFQVMEPSHADAR